MRTMYAFVAAFAVLALSANVQADCGNCGPKDASGTKCASGACSGQECPAAGECAAGECSGKECATAGACSGKECAAAGTCSAGTCPASQCDSSKGCPIAAAMEQLPKLTYAVGEKSTCCPKEAASIAEESGDHLHYCVADKKFHSEAEAQAALIEATETFVASFTEAHTCPNSGKVSLAGKTQSCKKSAAQMAKVMQNAMSKVKFTYLVGDKECGCPVEAGHLAKETGKEKLFVVGDAKTCCEKTARLNLARAKYKAAIEAMVQAQAAAEKQEVASGT